jgi:predicted nuclease of predicted toxin-antitoxin system
VKILLDECLDWRLGRDLTGHDVRTVPQMGWAALKNGELLRRAQGEFEVFLTTDQNLEHQQNVQSFSIAVVVLRAKTNKLSDLQSLVPELLAKISSCKPGAVLSIGLP